MQRYFDGITTPIGRIHVVVTNKAVVRLYFPNMKWSECFTRSPRHPLIKKAKRELMEYFSGKRKRFTLPLSPEGTEFQKSAWSVLRRIPYGKTISYAEEAHRMGQQSAIRAVASANGKNPIPIIIPCHRVVGKDGALGGYSGGFSLKKKLLALENCP